MGAVQKLATTVIVGLVGLATLLVVYLANEPNRRAAEQAEQEHVAIERGIQSYIQNCVVCHGPAGEGFSEPGAQGTGRIGMPLGGSTEQGIAATERNRPENANEFAARGNALFDTINNGRGLMPAFGTGAEGGAILNPEQIYELVMMIQHADWDHVYNETVADLGGYPTFPPPPTTPEPAPSEPSAPSGGDGGAAFTVVSHDIYFDPAELTIPADQDVVVALPNEGAAPHNFSIDELGISVDQAPGETDLTATINAPAGDYEYYCNVPGHKEAGMVGTLTADPNAEMPAPAAAEAAPADGDASAAQPAAAAQEFTVVSHDIYFDPKELTIPADSDVLVHLPNEGAAPHNFSIDELGISVDQAPGETDLTATINAPAGTYEYYCNVPGHREAGMVGTLTADPNAAPPAAAAPAAGEATAAQDAAPAEAAPAAAAQEFTVVSHDIYFDPKELTIPADQDVVVHLPNEGAAPHNFSIDELGISVDQAPGETDLQTTINTAAGTYDFYCNVPGHKEAGMVGTLTVEAGAAPAADAPAAAPAEADTAEAAQDAAPTDGAEAAGDAPAAAQEFTVVSHDIYFDPKELTIPAATDVLVHLPNEGAAPHNFSIDELGISVDQMPGETDLSTTINAAAGTYDFYCNVPGHKEAGMVGVLTAE